MTLGTPMHLLAAVRVSRLKVFHNPQGSSRALSTWNRFETIEATHEHMSSPSVSEDGTNYDYIRGGVGLVASVRGRRVRVLRWAGHPLLLSTLSSTRTATKMK